MVMDGRGENMTVVVTGTGGCGTASAAQHFGIGHERVFTPYQPPAGFDIPDSSWLAAPYIPQIRLPVVHVVRNPTDVVGALLGGGIFDEKRRAEAGPYRRYIEHWCPQVFVPAEPIRQVCQFYLLWNRMIGDNPVKIEDLTTIRINRRPHPGRVTISWDDIPELETIAIEYGYL